MHFLFAWVDFINLQFPFFSSGSGNGWMARQQPLSLPIVYTILRWRINKEETPKKVCVCFIFPFLFFTLLQSLAICLVISWQNSQILLQKPRHLSVHPLFDPIDKRCREREKKKKKECLLLHPSPHNVQHVRQLVLSLHRHRHQIVNFVWRLRGCSISPSHHLRVKPDAIASSYTHTHKKEPDKPLHPN